MFQLKSQVSTPIAMSMIVFLSALTIIYYVNHNVADKYSNLYDYGDDLVVTRYNKKPVNKVKVNKASTVDANSLNSSDQTLPSSSETAPQ
ncbi:MAG: hypothetical protein Q7R78_00180 [bacterium]|nr:hypothetical protein [bacterium]